MTGLLLGLGAFLLLIFFVLFAGFIGAGVNDPYR
jgi:hypothetical protein